MAKKKTKRFGNPAKNAEYQAREARLHGASLSEKDSYKRTYWRSI